MIMVNSTNMFLLFVQMINENTEPKDDQTILTPPTSTINHTVEQITKQWKQISFQGFDKTPQETKLKISTPSIHSIAQRVNIFFLFYTKLVFFYSSLFVEQQLLLNRIH